MAEEFGVGQGAADGATVHSDEGRAAPVATVMDRAGNNLFARSALPNDEDAGVCRRRQL
ncbi:hypothetical protein D3C87_2003500 [compost metagenome]